LLNLELNFMNSTLALTQSKLGLERAQAELNSFLAFSKETKIECIVPDDLPDLQIQPAAAVESGLSNNPQMLNQQQRLLEEDRKVNQAKSENGSRR
jgi:outer membrane protein TolC